VFFISFYFNYAPGISTAAFVSSWLSMDVVLVQSEMLAAMVSTRCSGR